jgi:hypothetical protein
MTHILITGRDNDKKELNKKRVVGTSLSGKGIFKLRLEA